MLPNLLEPTSITGFNLTLEHEKLQLAIASIQFDFRVECRTIVSIVAATIGTIVRQ